MAAACALRPPLPRRHMVHAGDHDTSTAAMRSAGAVSSDRARDPFRDRSNLPVAIRTEAKEQAAWVEVDSFMNFDAACVDHANGSSESSKRTGVPLDDGSTQRVGGGEGAGARGEGGAHAADGRPRSARARSGEEDGGGVRTTRPGDGSRRADGARERRGGEPEEDEVVPLASQQILSPTDRGIVDSIVLIQRIYRGHRSRRRLVACSTASTSPSHDDEPPSGEWRSGSAREWYAYYARLRASRSEKGDASTSTVTAPAVTTSTVTSAMSPLFFQHYQLGLYRNSQNKIASHPNATLKEMHETLSSEFTSSEALHEWIKGHFESRLVDKVTSDGQVKVCKIGKRQWCFQGILPIDHAAASTAVVPAASTAVVPADPPDDMRAIFDRYFRLDKDGEVQLKEMHNTLKAAGADMRTHGGGDPTQVLSMWVKEQFHVEYDLGTVDYKRKKMGWCFVGFAAIDLPL